MYCKSCGKYVEKNSKVCAHCGQRNFQFEMTSVGKIRNYVNTSYIKSALIYIVFLLVLTFIMTLTSSKSIVNVQDFMEAWSGIFIITGMIGVLIPYRIPMLRRSAGWSIVFYCLALIILTFFS